MSDFKKTTFNLSANDNKLLDDLVKSERSNRSTILRQALHLFAAYLKRAPGTRLAFVDEAGKPIEILRIIM